MAPTISLVHGPIGSQARENQRLRNELTQLGVAQLAMHVTVDMGAVAYKCPIINDLACISTFAPSPRNPDLRSYLEGFVLGLFFSMVARIILRSAPD